MRPLSIAGSVVTSKTRSVRYGTSSGNGFGIHLCIWPPVDTPL